ncbi:MAG: sorbosone dehydrogenase family protein, partial [Flavobacteriaceae bacterium]
FHPNFSSNGYFYINYNPDVSRTRVCRFQVSASNPNQADPNSETLILEFQQPFNNHNGGQLAFGPDGMLYISSGDGGSGGDPDGHAQNLTNLLGAILRIDVNTPANGLNYGIPADNPFLGQPGARGEIYAYGLRNPWRMSFDVNDGTLWTGDVGQNEYEEIDIIKKGANYGWNILEGNHCFNANSCDTEAYEAPIFEYPQTNKNQSVTGGYVYHGSTVEQLSGKYVYGDFVSGRIWTLETNGSANTEIMDTNLGIASFGTDAQNELYICAFDGKVYKFVEE